MSYSHNTSSINSSKNKDQTKTSYKDYDVFVFSMLNDDAKKYYTELKALYKKIRQLQKSISGSTISFHDAMVYTKINQLLTEESQVICREFYELRQQLPEVEEITEDYEDELKYIEKPDNGDDILNHLSYNIENIERKIKI